MVKMNNSPKYNFRRNSVALIVALLLILPTLSGIVTASHTSSVELNPEWSPANQNVHYTVTFCKLSGDTVNEVRIYKNYDGSVYYSDFSCEEKPGWELLYISVYPACFYVANQSSPDYNPLDINGECANFSFSATSPGPEYCDLAWRFETRDDKDYWQYLYDNTSVDDKAPILTKTITGPTYGTCPPENGQECWMTQDTEIKINVTDVGDCGVSGLRYCIVSYRVDGGNPIMEKEENLGGEKTWTYSFKFKEDSVHELNVTCFDVAGNKLEDIETFKVDTTKPSTEKTYGEPKYPDSEHPKWITSNTPITLEAEDGGEICASGVDKTWYITLLVPDEYCEGNCEPICDNPYTFEDCGNTMKTIEWCQGNCSAEWQNLNYTSWENCVDDCVHRCCNGEPQGNDPIFGECDPHIYSCDISCSDTSHTEDWRLYNGSAFRIPEESCHLIQYFSVDNLGNVEEMNYQCVYVDNTPPEGGKEIGDPKIPCSENENCDYWVRDHVTPITLTCEDQEPHPVNHNKVCFRVSVDGDYGVTDDYCTLYNGNMNDGYCCVDDNELEIKFQEDSNHTLDYYCVDALGNKNEVDSEKFRVDSQPPIINKTITGPTYGTCPPGEGESCWLKDWESGEGSVIHIEATDNDTLGCAINNVKCRWWYYVDGEGPYYVVNGDTVSGKSDWLVPPFDIRFYDETEHELHVECKDDLGNSVEDVETFYVDSTPPTTEKTIGEPLYTQDICIGTREWINSSTPIYLNVSDGDSVCSSGVNKTYYKDIVWPTDAPCRDLGEACYYAAEDLAYNDSIPWQVYTGPIYKNEESCHILVFYSVDNLGNVENFKYNCMFVDNKPPIGEVTTGDPKIPCSENENCDYWVRDHVTPITLTCEDQEPHPSGVKQILYRWKLDGEWPSSNPNGEWLVYQEPIIFNEDSVHELEFVCVDNLGNIGEVQKITYKVDSTPPIINKTMIGEEGKDWIGNCPPGPEQTCYVSGNGGVSISVKDPDPTGNGCNVSNITCTYEVWWKNEKVQSGTFTDPVNITFDEDCLHTLIINCTDALGNSYIDTEEFNVDITPPQTQKLYGLPTIVDGTPTYRWITPRTNITLMALDNKVGIEDTYYRVTLLNIPDEDCIELCGYTGNGSWNVYDGTPFQIPEESCHLIEYYSVDKLGNTEPIHKQCVFVDNKPPLPTKSFSGPHYFKDSSLAYFEDFESGAEGWTHSSFTVEGEDNWELRNVTCGGTDLGSTTYGTIGNGCDGILEQSYLESPWINLTDVSNPYLVFDSWTYDEGGCPLYDVETIEVSTDGVHWTLITGCTDFPLHATNDGKWKTLVFDMSSFGGKMVKLRFKYDTVDECCGYEEGWYIDNVRIYDVGEIWATQETYFNLDCRDQEPHPVQKEILCFKVFLNDTQPIDLTEEYCNGNMNDGYCCVYVGQLVEGGGLSYGFNFKEDSHHVIRYFCIDGLGQESQVYKQEYYVDSTPPTTEKTYVGPYLSNEIHNEWITSKTNITLEAEDGGKVCAIDNVTTYYQVTLIPDENCYDPQTYCQPMHSYDDENWTVYTQPFSINEESCHLIEFYSVDALGNKEPIKYQCVFVDNTAPNLTKTHSPGMIEDYDEELGEFHWMTQDMSIFLECKDQEPHPVNMVTLRYRIWNDVNNSWSEWFEDSGYWSAYATINFDEDSVHKIQYYCFDSLGNSNGTQEAPHEQTYKVDSTPPTTEKTYVGPYYVNDGVEFIDSVTKIKLNATDGGEVCAINNVTTYYQVSLITSLACYEPEEYCFPMHSYDDENWTVYTQPFSINEESCHLIEFYSVDALGNKEPIKYQCVFSDKTPPEVILSYGTPSYEGENSTWITSETPVNVETKDPQPHASGVKEVLYRTTLVGDEYCKNEDLCQEAEGSGEWKTLEDGTFYIPEESCHLIEIKAIDNVDKERTIKECVFVDNTGPDPVKEVGKPKDMWTPGENGDPISYYYPEANENCWKGDNWECWEVTTLTPVKMQCIDKEPHPVGAAGLCFKVDLDGDDATEQYCEKYNGAYNITGDGYCCVEGNLTIYFGEETEHELEYYCVDRLENEGSVDIEKFKVEGTAFNITLNKKWNLISVPFVMLNNSIETVFADIADKVASVWTYDGETGQWYVYTPGEAPDSLTEMKPGWGYWVLTYDKAVLTIGGSLFTPAKTPPVKKLVKGWNLIGYFGTEGILSYDEPYGNGKPAYCALYSLVDTVIGNPRWSSIVTYWQPNTPSPWIYLSNEDKMDPGAGYWIEMDVNDTYSYSTTCGIFDLLGSPGGP